MKAGSASRDYRHVPYVADDAELVLALDARYHGDGTMPTERR
ncbi:hypothetical protein [Mesorhizobium sp. M0488]